MEFSPQIRFGWLNGWILIGLFHGIFILLLRVFPKEVVERLYDRSAWTRQQRALGAAGLPFAFAGLILIVVTPLKIGQSVFLVGMILYFVGFIGFLIAMFNFRNTPLDRPVVDGLYRYSRNPQWVTFAVVMVATSIAIGSGLATLLFSVRILLNHFRILGEERSCLERYGDTYREYMQRVPRYLVF